MARRIDRVLLPLLLVSTLIVPAACRKVNVPDAYQPAADHSDYAQSLEISDLNGTALGRQWISAGEKALASPVRIEPPLEETGYWNPSIPAALAFQFGVQAGQRIEIGFQLRSTEENRVFIDLFRVSSDGKLSHVASQPSGESGFSLTSIRDGEYLLRAQPELLRGGSYTVTIITSPYLSFPVQDHSSRNIGSFFGDSRDAGRRVHEGVDIFAPRHTPVLAPSEVIVSRVGESERGGNIIYMRDVNLPLNYYYAHLETQSIETGARVGPGTVIGTVGNSGNAITTPPHLHFGVYIRRGEPVDPFHYLQLTDTHPEAPRGDLGLLGEWGRITLDKVSLLSAPWGERTGVLAVDTPAMVTAVSGRYFRIRLPDGRHGYISYRFFEEMDRPLEEIEPSDQMSVLDQPHPEAAVVRRLDPGERVAVFGKFRGYCFVLLPDTGFGWLPPFTS